MQLNVNIDRGIAVNEKTIAYLLRSDDDHDKTIIGLVSGDTFCAEVPFSEMVDALSNKGRSRRVRVTEGIAEFMKQHDPEMFDPAYIKAFSEALAKHLIEE